MDGQYDTIDLRTDAEWQHHVRFTVGPRWLVVYFSTPGDPPHLMDHFRQLATRFPDLTFARVRTPDVPAIPSLAEAGIPLVITAPRFEVVIAGKSLSSQPNAKGSVIQAEHLLDGKLEQILSTMVGQQYVVRKPVIQLNPEQLSTAAGPVDTSVSPNLPQLSK
eukprot:EG_transcript_27445